MQWLNLKIIAKAFFHVSHRSESKKKNDDWKSSENKWSESKLIRSLKAFQVIYYYHGIFNFFSLSLSRFVSNPLINNGFLEGISSSVGQFSSMAPIIVHFLLLLLPQRYGMFFSLFLLLHRRVWNIQFIRLNLVALFNQTITKTLTFNFCFLFLLLLLAIVSLQQKLVCAHELWFLLNY